MTDEWAIASLSQAIEGDDEDDDDVLIPPTPGQEEIDIATPAQDSASLLGAMADSQAAGRRKMHTLSLGLPDDPESESLPFLALEWDPQFPPTPAPENGQSADNYYLNKDKDDSVNNKSKLSNQSCNGQSMVWECSTSWLTTDAEASGIRTATGGSGDEGNSCKNKDKIEGAKREGKNVDDRGGGGDKPGGGSEGSGGGEDGGDGEGGDGDDSDDRKKKKESKEEEESSHEPSSDSSEGLQSLSERQKKGETSSGDAPASVAKELSPADEELTTRTSAGKTSLELGEVEACSSQKDLFSSQSDQGKDVEQVRHPDNKQQGEMEDRAMPPPAVTMPILQLSQAEGDEEEVPASTGKLFPDTTSAATSMEFAPTPTHFSSSLHLTPPPKRKLSEDEDNEGGPSEIPFKQPRTEDFSGSSESGEEKVFVDYTTLTKKDVEISPKQQKLPPRNMKPPHLSSAAKRITFNVDEASGSTGEQNVASQKEHTQEMSEEIELPSLSPVDTEDEGIRLSDPPRRLPADTEEESSDNNDRDVRRIIGDTSDDVPLVDTSPKDSSDKDDSDIEIIEDKDRSIEVVYEKSKGKSSNSDNVGSQDFSLMLSGTQQESPPCSEEQGQRFSEEHKFSEEFVQESQESQSQSLLPMSDAEDLRCHGTLSSSSDEGQGDQGRDLPNTMPATQMEEICKPAVLTQPDIEPLISLPISSSAESRSKLGETEVPSDADVEDDDQDMERDITSQESQASLPDISSTKSTTEKRSSDENHSPKSITKLQMPDILTPSSQDVVMVHESESVFVKAANAAKERVQQDESRKEEKRVENLLESRSDSSFECMEASVSKVSENIKSDESRVEVSSAECTPVSGLQLTISPSSTPVSSQLQRMQSQSTNLFGSNKKENITSDSLQASKIYVEETDSEEEGPTVRKRKKLRTKSTSQSSEIDKKPMSAVKKDLIKTSTPNTSQGASLNLSSVGGSDIDKDPPGTSVMTETSKSNNSSVEQLKPFKSPESLKSQDTEVSSQDTEILLITENIKSHEQLLKAGFKYTTMQVLEYKDPVTNESHYAVEDPTLEKVGFTKLTFQPISGLGGSSSSTNARGTRISDVSMLSHISSSSGSGYLGDKSSSSSGSSRRLSMLSTTESSRLSVGSVITLGTLPSPPHEKYDIEKRGDGNFALPTSRAKSQASGKSGATSPKVITIDASTSPKRRISPHRKSYKSPDSSSTTSDDFQEKKSRGRGRAKGRGGRSTPSEQSLGRGHGRGRARGKGRGRGRGNITPGKAVTELSDQEHKESPDVISDKPIPRASKSNVESVEEEGTSKGRLSDAVTSVADVIDTLPEFLCKILQNSQLPLSEEEEEIFVLQGADQETQLAQVMKRVREVDLKPGLLVFARFTDNNFYSALLKERDGSDRWHVQFTLDQHPASVREVYLLPTDLLPRGHPCFVRHPTEQFSDPGVVKAHIRVESTLLHIIETDRGTSKRIPHSHMFLTGQQAHELLQARLNFRSMVASPGRDVSLDNIVAGRRRRTPNIQLSSTRTGKDDNLDSSESPAEFDDLASPLIHSPSTRKVASRGRQGIRRQDLSVLPEESESEMDASATPVTPKGQKRSTATRLSRTPKTPKASLSIEAHSSAATPESKSLGAITEDLQLIQISELQKEQTPKTPPKKRGRPPGQSSSTQTPQKVAKLEEVIPSDPRLGPLPPDDSQIFSGFVILMTSGDSRIRKRQSEDDEDLPPFDKGYMKLQITRGGGRVIENYAEAEIIMAEQGRPVFMKHSTSKSKKKNITSTVSTVLLISNTHCCTAKFIQCLAAGVPIVSFQWVINSIIQGKCENWSSYLLPSGENELGEPVEQKVIFEEGFQSGPPQVLVGERIFLATSTNTEFNSFWQPILNTAGADVRVKPAKTGNLSRALVSAMTVVVADNTIPEKELQRAEHLKIPLVSTKWVIQCLIAGQRLGYTDNPEFLHTARVSPTPNQPEEN